mgnify:CR=1 FL=1
MKKQLLFKVMTMAVAAMMLVSIFFDAALADPANPGLSPNPVRAPWYFAGLQELLLHIHPAVAVSVFPLLAATFFQAAFRVCGW